MHTNPLVTQLRHLLIENPVATSEYTLIRQLVEKGLLASNYAATPLALFQTHFQLMNALYQLQEEWLADGVCLHISALEIHLEKYSVQMTDSRALGLSGLRNFYLDWRHYEMATEESVDSLLKDFWRQYAAQGVGESEQREALAILGLSDPADFVTIKHCYRRLAMIHHPDRGGDDESLQRINNAMAILERVYGM
jgi:DnaJ-domain-containing protein 1